MHPSRAFAWQDEAELRAFVREIAFAQICAVVDDRPALAQAPLSIDVSGGIAFHLARSNRLVPALDGAAVAAVVTGQHFYVSPDWYGTDDQVPTWNYRLVEIEGIARRLDEQELRDQLDTLSAAQEALLAPKQPWTAAKMSSAKLAAMMRAIVGYALDAPVLRGVRKLGQNKSPAKRAGAIAGLRGLGRVADAALMERGW